jgi:hypothetical protein
VATRRKILALGLCWLAWIWLVAILAGRLTPWLSGPHGWPDDMDRRVTPLTRWDSGWYLSIAAGGYQPPPSKVGEETNHAFFPLYPALMRLLARTTRLETSRAGNLISAAAFLGALLLFADWLRLHFEESRVTPALLALVFFPTSFFFAAVYTESLLLFLALAAVLALEKDRPLLSLLAGFLSGLTRVSCVVLAPYLALVSLRKDKQNGVPLSRALPRAALFGASPLAGFGLFCLYFWTRFGDPLLFVKAQHNWSREPKTIFQGPLLILDTAITDITTGRIFHKSPARTLEGFLLLLFVYLGYRLFRERLRPEAVYVLLTTGIVLTSGTLESAGRYVLPAFPAFAILGGLAGSPVAPVPRRLALIALGLCAVTQAVYVWLFVNWLWVG